MGERDRHEQGTFSWTDLATPDAQASKDFYGMLFGWEFEDNPIPDDGVYVMARVGGRAAAAMFETTERHPAWASYVTVDDVDAATARAGELGANVLAEPFDVMDAGRMAVVTDREGAAFCVWQAKQNKGAQIVNEPGSLSFNGLGTRDIEAAKSFYGSVFGWTTLDVGGGAEMWTLPGYGDHLERDNPDLRKQLAETGGPPGFEDVVASIVPLADDQPDTPPHWSVTFAVDDADATAARATELGGTLAVPPLDAPWVRMTIINDPQGATLIASQFVPENKDIPSS
jgi:uncharacterized protein